ncbi:MAG: type VI secretion system tube protein Hcp [Desulfobacterales bacterium]
MKNRFDVVVAALVLFLAVVLPQGVCAQKGHMSVIGIEGESLSGSCLGCIEILTVTESQVKGERSVVVTKLIDRSSIEWRILSATGDTLPEVTIQFYTGGEINFKFWEMKLVDVTVKSVIMKALTGESKPEEKIELVPGRILWTYVPQKADGTMGTEVTDSFDYKTDK